MDGTLFSRVRTADRTVIGCGSRHFQSDTRRYMYVGMIAVNGMLKIYRWGCPVVVTRIFRINIYKHWQSSEGSALVTDHF